MTGFLDHWVWALAALAFIAQGVADLVDDFRAAGSSPATLVSLYEFDQAAATENTIAGAPAAVLNLAESRPGVDSSDKGQVFVERAGNVKVTPNIPPVSPLKRANTWSMLLDLKYADMGKFTSLYQTNLANDDDGEGWLKNTDVMYLGIGVHTYVGNELREDSYFRVVITADFTHTGDDERKNSFRYYVNGRLVNDATGRCTACVLDGRFTLDEQVLLLTDNDGEEAPALLTTVAFWSESLAPRAVERLGGPSFGATDAPMCASVDELGSFLRVGLPQIPLANPTLGVTKCGDMCCRATGSLPCGTRDARFAVSQDSGACEVLSSRSVCSASRTENVPGLQMGGYGFFCTPHSSTPAPPMEPLIAFLGGSEPEQHPPSVGAYYAAIKAFFAGLVIPESAIHPSMKKIFAASIQTQTAKGLREPFSLMQQTTYELVYANRGEVRAAALSSNHSGGSQMVKQDGTHFSISTSEDVGKLFRENRQIPVPVAVIAGDGIEFCDAVARSVEQGTHTAMMSVGCAGSAMKPKVRTVHSGDSATCKKWKNLLSGLGIHKFGILWSKSWLSSFYYERFASLALPSCMPRCTSRLEGSVNSTCLSLVKEACVPDTPSATCQPVSDALRELKEADVRVIVVGLDSQTGDFATFSNAASELNMVGPRYQWMLMSDETSTMTSPKMTAFQIANFGDRFDGALLVSGSCDGPMWDKFQTFLNTLTVEDFPPGLKLGEGKTIAGGATYGVLYHLHEGFAGYFWYHKEVISAMIARAVDATWAVLLAMNSLVTKYGHAPYALPPEALIAEMDKLQFPGVCGSEISWTNEGQRTTATPLRIYNLRRVNDSFENQRNLGNFYNFVDESLGVVTEREATFTSSPRYFAGAKTLPAHVPPDCNPGEQALDDMYCHQCPLGRHQPTGGRGRQCTECQAGYVAATVGLAYCEPCPPGTEANADASQRVPCEVGKVSTGDGCLNCTVGQHAPSTGLSKCLACPQGSYSAVPGAGSCESCPSGLTTKFPGAESSEECKCPEGTYFSGSACTPCPLGMSCPFGAESKQGAAVYPLLQPMYWSDPSDPLSVYRCENEDRCPGGDPGTCNNKLTERSCAHCEDEWIWDGKACSKCKSSETTAFTFPILPVIILPIIIVLLYKLFGDTYQRWASWQNGLASMGFILLNHYQVISLARGASIQFPYDVAVTWDTFLFSSDVSTIFKPACAGFSDFQSSLVVKSLAPLIVGLLFLLTVAASYGVAQAAQLPYIAMTRDRTLNAFFGLIFTFFAGIVGMAFTIFKCAQNPNDKKTLIIDRSVICYESDWNGMLVVGLLSVLLWCFGFGAIFVRAVIRAPNRFADEGFQMRWKFLFIKFRPDVYWFSLVLVAKGILMNFGFLFLDTGVAQIYWVMVVIQIYLGFNIAFRPWRHMTINGFDTYAHFALVLVLSALTWFARDSLDDRETIDQDMSNMIIAFSFITFPIAVPVFWNVAYTRLSPKYQANVGRSIDSMHKAILKLALVEDFNGWVLGLQEWDFWFLKEATGIIAIELLGMNTSTKRYTTKTLSGLSLENEKKVRISQMGDDSEANEKAAEAVLYRQKTEDSLALLKLDVELLDAVTEINEVMNNKVGAPGNKRKRLVSPRDSSNGFLPRSRTPPWTMAPPASDLNTLPAKWTPPGTPAKSKHQKR